MHPRNNLFYLSKFSTNYCLLNNDNDNNNNNNNNNN